MRFKIRLLQFLGGLLLAIGIVSGLALSGLIVWGDLEASVFMTGFRSEKHLSSLKCPSVITAGEVGTISAELKNPTEKHLERFLIASISDGYISLVRETRTKLTIEPSEKVMVEWNIFPDDAAFNQRVILFRVFVNPRYPHPSMDGTCGVVYLNVAGFTGGQIIMGMWLVTLFCLSLGLLLIEIYRQSAKKMSHSELNSAYTLAGIVLASSLAGSLGYWVIGLILITVAVLLLGTFLSRHLAHKE